MKPSPRPRSASRRWLLSALLSLAVGCAAPRQTEAPAAPPAPAPAPAPPQGVRLPQDARPTRYAVSLTVDPRRDTFEGEVDIALELARPLTQLWLNGVELEVVSASLAPDGQPPLPATPLPSPEQLVGFAFPREVGPGKAHLTVRYRGRVSDRDSSGVFRQEDRGAWYAFTQFEPDDARRAVPSFDEPGDKVPWQLTLRVPQDTTAFANTPVASEGQEGALRVFRFEETPPLPSYLLAFAVGPFERVDAGTAGTAHVPVGIVVPRGRAAEAQHAARTTGPILEALERYFGRPYPYRKLDVVSIPITTTFGAMENPGLVTFVSGLVLARPEQDTLQRQRDYVEVQAHELAHQWFGDLVTMKWWDDVWLNESFATWMEYKIAGGLEPGWGLDVAAVKDRSSALDADSLATARRIRQPIESRGDIANAFDGITYSKGGAVLAMFEQHVGEQAFRQGIQRYLERHQHANADASEFLAAISEAAGRDIAPLFTTFLEQEGAPLVSLRLACAKGEPPRLDLTQRRYLPVGSAGERDRTWGLPVCVRYGRGGRAARACTVLTGASGQLALPEAGGCPEWVVPNADMKGYYRASLEGGGLLTLMRGPGARTLTRAEKVGLVGDARALVRSGDLAAADALGLVQALMPSEDREVVLAALGLVQSLPDALVPEALRPRRARFVRQVFGPLAARLGFDPRPGESEDARLLRPRLLEAVGSDGEDPRVRAEARRRVERWLTAPGSLAPEVLPAALNVAAEGADAALRTRLVEAAGKADRHERNLLLGALGHVRAPELVQQNLALAFSGRFDPREAMQLVQGAAGDPRTREAVYAYVKAHFDDMVKVLPRDFGAYLPFVAAGFCDAAHRQDVAGFFDGRSTRFNGGPRTLAQVLERIDLCIALERAQGPSVARFFGRP